MAANLSQNVGWKKRMLHTALLVFHHLLFNRVEDQVSDLHEVKNEGGENWACLKIMTLAILVF